MILYLNARIVLLPTYCTILHLTFILAPDLYSWTLDLIPPSSPISNEHTVSISNSYTIEWELSRQLRAGLDQPRSASLHTATNSRTSIRQAMASQFVHYAQLLNAEKLRHARWMRNNGKNDLTPSSPLATTIPKIPSTARLRHAIDVGPARKCSHRPHSLHLPTNHAQSRRHHHVRPRRPHPLQPLPHPRI